MKLQRPEQASRRSRPSTRLGRAARFAEQTSGGVLCLLAPWRQVLGVLSPAHQRALHGGALLPRDRPEAFVLRHLSLWRRLVRRNAAFPPPSIPRNGAPSRSPGSGSTRLVSE